MAVPASVRGARRQVNDLDSNALRTLDPCYKPSAVFDTVLSGEQEDVAKVGVPVIRQTDQKAGTPPVDAFVLTLPDENNAVQQLQWEQHPIILRAFQVGPRVAIDPIVTIQDLHPRSGVPSMSLPNVCSGAAEIGSSRTA
jgi:hypothetical protein